MSNASPKRAAIILAAGKSTRMKSVKSKVLHPVGGRPMLEWVADLAASTGSTHTVCVVGEANADVRASAEKLGLIIAVQEPQQGTAHAVQCAKDAMAGFEGHVAVLYADTPLIEAETLERVYASLDANDLAVLGFEPEDPGAYGRLITQGDELTAIVEAKEASPEQLAVRLCNSGVMAGDAAILMSAVDRVDNKNIKGEYYLTDVVEILRQDGKRSTVVNASETEVMGVNAREDLALAEQAFQTRMRQRAMGNGVTLHDPETTYFAWDTEIANDATIGANVVFGPGVSIGSHTVVHPFSHIEGTSIGEHAQIGPFARLRPGTRLDDKTKVGNFVETKKTHLGEGSKINHLSYIGDAEVGRAVNIGAGTITCNYDGYNKHKTVIGDGAFIGTQSGLVAPVTIGKGAFLGTGGVITKDVPEGALALARAHQTNKDGWAERFHAAQQKRKADREKKS